MNSLNPFKIRSLPSLLIFFCLYFFSVFAYANVPFDQRPEVQAFIKQMVKKHKFQKKELTALFKNVKVRPKVMQSIKAPLEKKPWYTYQLLFVTEWRIREGVEFWRKYHDTLKRAEKIYGVPASIIVATIGVETKYGRNKGDYPVIDALTNIAFGETPRAPYFKKELEQFLLLTREQHLNPRKVLGSYAGAIGQPQFMPSSYRHFAVNFSGSGKIDLSHNEADVIGSIANYYRKHGWKTGEPIAIPLASPRGKFQLSFLQPRTPSSSEKFKNENKDYVHLKSQLLTLEGSHGPEEWNTFHNFNVIKRYNISDLYAMAVYQLSHYITDLREKTNGAIT